MAQTETAHGWLQAQEMADVRERVPIVYVEAIPVRVDHLGRVDRVGLLLRHRPDGTISRALVSGRVLYGETIREALWRNLSKDLGPESMPQLPPPGGAVHRCRVLPRRRPAQRLHRPAPARGVAGVRRSRRGRVRARAGHARSCLADAGGSAQRRVAAEMSGGQDRLVRLGLAFAGLLP